MIVQLYWVLLSNPTANVKAKLCEAEKCLFRIIRVLRKEGYGQKDVDPLFKSVVLTYGLSFYGASKADLVVMDCFLKRCH